MIAVGGIVVDQLPVAVLDDACLVGNLGIAQVVHRQIGLGEAGKGIEIGRLIGKADIDQPFEIAAMNRLQPVLRRVEIRTHIARPQQLSIQVIGPLVIGTDQLGRHALRLVADNRPAMPARVVKGADHAVGTAHDHHAVAADLMRDIAARLGQFARRNGKQPVAVEKRFHIRAKDFGIGVKGPFQRITGAAPCQQIADRVTHFVVSCRAPRTDRGRSRHKTLIARSARRCRVPFQRHDRHPRLNIFAKAGFRT